MIATRREFVVRRNAFFSMLCEMRRVESVTHRLSVYRATGRRATWADAAPRPGPDSRVGQAEADYAELCEISAMDHPSQDDFRRADVICRAWGV